MLPQQNRLKRKKDFERVFKKGKGTSKDFLFLKIVKNNLGVSRFGFAIGLRVSKKAVVRNKIKRMLREIVREKLPQIKQGIDVVVVVRPDVKQKSFAEIKEAVQKIFDKADIIRGG